MRKLILSLTFAITAFSFANSQGVIKETVDPRVSILMQRYVDGNKSAPTIKGWRIQLLATTDRQRMENALTQFQALYPSVATNWVHAKPYYKIRAGAFATKRDALRTLYLLKRDYPAAYPVQDIDIKPEELLR